MFAANGSVRLAYDDLGPPEGEPILLLMGLAASRFWWPPGLLAAFRDQGLRCVVMDLRDAGESDRVPGGYTAEDLTDDVIAVADDLGLPGVHVFGLSFGGVVAQRVALRHPGRVRSMTCCAGGPADASPARVLLRHLRPVTQLRVAWLTWRTRSDADLVTAVMTVAGYAGGADHARAAAARDRAIGIRSFRSTAETSRQLRARWHGPRLGEMRVPALILCGENGRLVHPRAAREAAAAIPGARLHILPGVGHMPSHDAWPVIAKRVRETVTSS